VLLNAPTRRSTAANIRLPLFHAIVMTHHNLSIEEVMAYVR
jgi:hypothetical protein